AFGDARAAGFGGRCHFLGDKVGIFFIGGYGNPDDNVVIFQFVKIEKVINKWVREIVRGAFFTDRGSF
ncbi:MAG TPA: hypothetical protein PK678_09325, partial [Ferruginibacter sp.]|nr:hypothetical protein [Ferruginibacter sp.]